METDGTAFRLRFTRRLGHPQHAVWRALTDPEQLAAWFPQRIEGLDGDPAGIWRTGAEITFRDPQGRGPAFTGEVLAFEPETLVEFSWGTDTIRLELAADGADASVLTLLDTLEQHGTGARNAAGWHECLDYLGCALDGRKPDFRPGQRWAQTHPRYVRALGPEAATIGPPPGRQPPSE
ncbi:SRPBCC domain-containing protein [Phaeacidiphilus oryzae]|uniref:SRPBCC domain-containing protein n=1 Tax=Phaeacidiphilus oryzae TaxID=348818 RepID=UPI0009FF0915|nr:SRPBCC domain-containing protein [Phaeacidiphilus oryzae]